MDKSIAALQNGGLDEEVAFVQPLNVFCRDSTSLVERLWHENKHACIDVGLVEKNHFRVSIDLVLERLGEGKSCINQGFNAGTTKVLDGGPELQSIECLGSNTWSDLS